MWCSSLRTSSCGGGWRRIAHRHQVGGPEERPGVQIRPEQPGTLQVGPGQLGTGRRRRPAARRTPRASGRRQPEAAPCAVPRRRAGCRSRTGAALAGSGPGPRAGAPRRARRAGPAPSPGAASAPGCLRGRRPPPGRCRTPPPRGRSGRRRNAPPAAGRMAGPLGERRFQGVQCLGAASGGHGGQPLGRPGDGQDGPALLGERLGGHRGESGCGIAEIAGQPPVEGEQPRSASPAASTRTSRSSRPSSSASAGSERDPSAPASSAAACVPGAGSPAGPSVITRQGRSRASPPSCPTSVSTRAWAAQ